MPDDDARVDVLMILEGRFPAMGGAERQLQTLAAALMRDGHGVELVCPRLDPALPAGRDRVQGLPVWRIAFPRLPVLGKLVLLVRLAAWLVAHRARYDAIHVHIAHHMGAVAAVVGALLGKPVIVKFSGWWETERGCLRNRTPGATLSRWMLRRATAVQAISRRFATDLVDWGFPADRVHWLPNAVDTKRFGATPLPPSGTGTRILVYVGRLVPEKGLNVLLQAWAMTLGHSGSGWRLRLVGDGPLLVGLQAQAQALGVADTVDFAGASDHVEEELALASAGVLPSRFEGLSNTLLEYLSAGLPVVATRISGNEDFVRDGYTGWLSEPGDAASLAVALQSLGTASAPQLADMGAQARAAVVERASIPVVTGRLLALYGGSR